MRRSLLLFLALFCAPARADAQADAQKLKDEAVAILKANAARQATAEDYANCIFKLEQARDMLEKAGANDSPLAQDVSTTLFWAKRFSDVKVIAALEKLRGGGGAGVPARAPAKKADPPKPPPARAAQPDEPDEPPDTLADAKKAFQAAESYAKSHSEDEYSVALRWFQMAAENPGTDYAIKALSFARDAQMRFAAKSAAQSAAAEQLPDTAEMKLVQEADALALAGKYEQSFALYQASLKAKESLIAHRKLGHAYYKRAQQIKDEFTPQFEAADAARREAWRGAFITVRTLGGTRRKFNPNYPPLVEAANKQAELVKKAYVAVGYYDKAHDEFKAVLRLAPEKKDLDAAGHQALCLTVKGDPNARSRGRTLLNSFLADYKPANDIERSLYEFCKSDLERINKGK